MLKIRTNLKDSFYEDKEIQNIMNENYQIKRNLIIQHKFVDFLENGKKYNGDFFSVYLIFNGLSNHISHIKLP